MSLDSAIQHLLNAKRITSASQSYKKDNPGESSKVFAYLQGGSRPSGVTTEMGVGLIEVEDERRAVQPEPEPEPEPEPQPGDHTSRSYLRWRGMGAPPSHITDYDFVMMDGAGSVAGLPSKMNLKYFDSIAVKGSDPRYPVSEAFARQHGLILKRPDGSELMSPYFPFYICDVADQRYIDEFARQGIAWLKAEGYDGCFLDDSARCFGMGSAKYSTPEQNEAAMIKFLVGVMQKFNAAGLYIMPNAGGYTSGDQRSNTGEIDAIYWEHLAAAGYKDNGIFIEYWQCHSNNPNYIRKSGTAAWYDNWEGWQATLVRGMALDVDMVGMCDSESRAHGVYCYASFLLEWNGRGSYVWCPYDSDPWIAPAGKPTGEKRRNGNRWERQYERGQVWVDPVTGTASIP